MGLIKTTIELRTYVTAIAKTFEFVEIQPYVDVVELDYMPKILGDVFYAGLKTRYDANTLTAAELLLLPYIQRAIANMAFLEAIPQLSVNLSSGGIVVPSGTNYAPASAYKIEELKDSYLRLGHKAFEHLIDYLVKNKASFADYSASTAFAEAVECFINTATEFSKHFNIRNNRWIYWNIKPIMKRLELDQIKTHLGATLYAEIKTQISTATISVNNEKLLVFIRPSIANLTIAESIDEMGLNMDEYGLTIYTSGTTNSQAVKLRNPVPRTNIDILKEKCLRVGDQKLKELDEYLFNNFATYPLYEDDNTVYKPDDATDITNISGSGHFRV